MVSIFNHLFLHIYHAVWLVIISKYLSYFILLLFWFQDSDLIYEIISYFKIILQQRTPCALTLSYIDNTVIFCNRHHEVQLTKNHSILCYFVVCFFLHPLWWIYQ